jgi:hypothetical protein
MDAFRQGDWKILRLPEPFGNGAWQLYHLSEDPGETEDLAERYPQRVEQLAAGWDEYAKANEVVHPDVPVAFVPVLLLLGARALPAQTETTAELSRAEVERFLLEAEIRDIREVGSGVTGSYRATLTDGRTTQDAHIQSVDIFMQKFTSGAASEFNFRDYWGFNIAAYRLDKLLDLNMVPVSVERTVDGERSAVTWWIDSKLYTAREFNEQGASVPDQTYFNDQKRVAWAFQQLVQNRDANQGNFLLDEDWRVWMIDFTRAFRPWKKLDDVEPLTRVSRHFYESLVGLDLDAVERELSPYLKKNELKGLFARRQALLKHFDRLIDERGESVVLIERPSN